MRKCPNCKKAVPVGARRCVHCRAVISEPSNESDSQESVRAVNLREDLNGTFSRNGGVSSQLDDASERRKRAQHQTIFGMGAIAANSPRNTYDDEPADYGQRTIAGMPGISFDALRRTMNRPSDSAPAAQPVEPARPVRPEPQPEPKPASADIIDSSFIEEMSLSLEPSKPVVQPTNAVSTAASSDDDPLAGLAGVAKVMPSSLVDEEFVDLTSKLFGDTFASIKDDTEEDDDDGWDFDMPTTPKPAAKAEPVAKAASAPVSNAEPAKQEAAPAPKQEAAPVPAPVEEEEEEEDDAAEDSALTPQKSASSIFDYITIGASIVATLCLIGWLVVSVVLNSEANPSEGVGIIAASVAGILANIGLCALKKKTKPLVCTIVFGILALILLFMMIMSPFAPGARPIMLIAIIAELGAAMSSFINS
ncbi:MAG: hypothetical protein II767_13130 [Proteobacteria bacterium]|nr:hypothetical protein [Pseudomonadota bacterium]